METDKHIPNQVDVAVIGAGPAGATVAALLGRYRPETSIAVFEREHFPRHRVGEGLIVDINRVLSDMGAVEKLEAANFPKKYGTTFIWGRDRTPSTFLFRDGAALVDVPDEYQLDYTWHVDRPTYDTILADCAASEGAHMTFGANVTDILEEDGRVSGLRVVNEEGVSHDVSARWVVDCSGGKGPVTRRFGQRVVDRELRNIAMFGYHRDLNWHDDLQGPPELRRTLIMTHPMGWVWVIPISRTETSVGFVTRVDTFQKEKARLGDDFSPESYYFSILKDLPEYDTLFAGSEPIDYRNSGRLVHTVQEYSFACENLWGPGWASCGDSAGFVDAILSIGCYVAQAHAQFLAYALATALDGGDEQLALGSYQTSVQENLSAFRAVTHMFYAYNSSRSDWWRECSGLLQGSALVPDGAERDSFLAFVNGFTARSVLYEEAVNAFGRQFLLSLGQQLFEGQELFDEDASYEAMRGHRERIEADPSPRMLPGYSLRPFQLPETGTGRLSEVMRLELESQASAVKGQAIGHRMYLPMGFAAVPELLDGSRSLSEVAREIAADGDTEAALAGVQTLAYRLSCAGALEFA